MAATAAGCLTWWRPKSWLGVQRQTGLGPDKLLPMHQVNPLMAPRSARRRSPGPCWHKRHHCGWRHHRGGQCAETQFPAGALASAETITVRRIDGLLRPDQGALYDISRSSGEHPPAKAGRHRVPAARRNCQQQGHAGAGGGGGCVDAVACCSGPVVARGGSLPAAITFRWKGIW